MSDRVFVVRPEDEGRGWSVARNALREACAMAKTGVAVKVTVAEDEDPRTLAQNAKLWPMLTDVSQQVIWHGVYLAKEDWKDLFSSLLQQQRIVPGIEGGFVALGLRTSKMKKAEFSDLIEIIYAFGSEREVRWSEKSLAIYDQYREAA